MKKIWLFSLVTVAATFTLLPLTTMASVSNDYYKGKTLEIINFGSLGGGNDAAGRVVAKHLGNHIPGKPTIVHKNMPGGGGTVAPNYVYNIAKKDGLTVLFGGGSPSMAYILQTKGTRFDYKYMTPVMAMPFGAVVYSRTDAMKKVTDILQAKDLIFGGDEPDGMTTCLAILSQKILGYNLHFAHGEIKFQDLYTYRQICS